MSVPTMAYGRALHRPAMRAQRGLRRIAPRALTLLLSLVTSCTFSADYAGTAFQCPDNAGCPPGFACVEDRCVAAYAAEPPSGVVAGEPQSDPEGPMGMVDARPDRPGPGDPPPPEADAGDHQEEPEEPPPLQPPQACIAAPDGSAAPESGPGERCDPSSGPLWYVAPDYPQALGVMAATAHDGVIHVLGGDVNYLGMSPAQTHRSFDPASLTYATRAAAPDPHVYGPCAVTDGDHVYVFGGWSGGGNLLRRYDTTLDRWAYMTPSPNRHVWGFACALVEGVLYVIGGSASSGESATGLVSAYDIASDSWSERGALPVPAYGLSGAAIGTRIYVVGRERELDIYDTVDDVWLAGTPMERTAIQPAVAAFAGALYVFGGVGSNQVDKLSLPEQTWSELPSMPTARSHAAAAVVDNQLHLIGGFTSSGTVALSSHEFLVVPAR